MDEGRHLAAGGARVAINKFQNDPEISARYQFWAFLYLTGHTVVRSAQRLREARAKPGAPSEVRVILLENLAGP